MADPAYHPRPSQRSLLSTHTTGIPPVLAFLLPRIPAVHEVMVFITVRHIPIPIIQPSERLLLRRLDYKGFYHVVARYGGCGGGRGLRTCLSRALF